MYSGMGDKAGFHSLLQHPGLPAPTPDPNVLSHSGFGVLILFQSLWKIQTESRLRKKPGAFLGVSVLAPAATIPIPQWAWC